MNRFAIDKWDKIFKNGPSKICGRQPLKCERVWSASILVYFHSNEITVIYK